MGTMTGKQACLSRVLQNDQSLRGSLVRCLFVSIAVENAAKIAVD